MMLKSRSNFFISSIAVEDGLKNLATDENKVEETSQETKSVKFWAEKSKPDIFFNILYTVF